MLDFAAPYWLLGVFLLVPLAALVLHRVREAWRYRQAFAPRALWDRMRLAGDETEVLVRSAVALLAVALLVVALADPRVGGRPGSDEGGERPRLFVLLDASKSMLASDTLYGGRAGAPDGRGGTRFAAAKALAGDLVRSVHGWQVGLIVFAAEPLVLCPATSDQSALLTLLERARAGDPTMKGGSNIENALRVAGTLIGGNRGAILLLSDGEELSGQAKNVAAGLARKKIRINTVGFGSTDAVPLRLDSGAALTWRGATVTTARNEALLAELARRTGGQYWPPPAYQSGVVGTPAGIEVASGMSLPSGRRQPGNSRKAVPIALALLLLAADAAWAARHSLGRIGRRAIDAWLGSRRAAGTAAAGLLVLFVGGWTWPAIPYVQRGLDAYRQGDASRSVALFQEAAKLDQGAEVRYDLGGAYHLAGRYASSLGAYKETLKKLPPRSRLAEHTHYNVGNTYFRMGDYRSAIEAYKKALAIDARDEDALHNLSLAESRLSKDRQKSRGGSKPTPGARQLGVIPMPDANEAAALLAQLEADERRRQAEAAQRDPNPDPSRETPSELARRLLKEAEQSVTRHLEKDW